VQSALLSTQCVVHRELGFQVSELTKAYQATQYRELLKQTKDFDYI